MSLSATIDWLSVTFKAQADTRLDLYGIKGDTMEIAARHNYTSAVRYKQTGVIKMWHSTSERQGVHFQYPGSALAALGASGIPPTAVLHKCLVAGGKVTRLDLAIDLIDERCSISSIARSVRRKDYKGRELKDRHIKSTDGGETLYLGADTSEKQIRIYNKAAESGLDMLWTRLEIELRDDAAKTIARAFHSGSMGTLHDACWSVACKMIDLTSNPHYNKFGRHTDDVGVPKIEKVTDTEKWIIEQVAPALEKFFRNWPTSPAYDAVVSALGRAFQKEG